MSGKKGKTILLLLFVGFLAFDATTSARPLSDDEKERLYSTAMEEVISAVDMTIDVSFMQEIVMNPEAVRKRRQAWDEHVQELGKKGGSARIKSLGISSPDGSEARLIKKRIRISSLSKIRRDTILFANKEMTETNYEGTIINTGFGQDSPSYQIEHKSKQASIFAGKQWAGREVLRFGKVDDAILMDIVGLCKPNQSQNAKAPKKKDFSYKGTGNVDGQVVDEIECINLESGKVKYKISLDPNDWHICHKTVWYNNKSGLVSKIVEYKEFAKVQVTGELFPRVVFRRYFDKEGKEKKVETTNVSNVVIGLPISEDVFRLDVPDEYIIIDNRYSPPRVTQPR